MTSLVSPEYDFAVFCNQMINKDPYSIMEAASAEISYARRLNRGITTDSDFRKGSRCPTYCDNLQRLISLLMNGAIPAGVTPEFLESVRPLVIKLLQKWELGKLRQFFSKSHQPQRLNLPETIDPLVVGISKGEVKAQDASAALSVLKRLIATPETAKEFVERVDISFSGYDQTTQELFEIQEVRDFVYQLDEQFPFWLFFLSKRYLGLQCILWCLLPPFLTEEGRSRIFPERINQLLTNRWLPAMNHICEYAGFSEKQIEQLTERALAYITKGRFPLDSRPFA
ncbi:MAG: hypothetical protein JW902_07105 [Syntrophaceae bacterium]|nr:hypothetical protein [Syntrophaceae bacterium]